LLYLSICISSSFGKSVSFVQLPSILKTEHFKVFQGVEFSRQQRNCS